MPSNRALGTGASKPRVCRVISTTREGFWFGWSHEGFVHQGTFPFHTSATTRKRRRRIGHRPPKTPCAGFCPAKRHRVVRAVWALECRFILSSTGGGEMAAELHHLRCMRSGFAVKTGVFTMTKFILPTLCATGLLASAALAASDGVGNGVAPQAVPVSRWAQRRHP